MKPLGDLCRYIGSHQIKPISGSEMDMFLKGERWVLDYADRKPSMIWGTLFELGKAIEVILAQTVTQDDIEAHMGQDGPWGWGGFPTEWLEAIAERIEYDGGKLVLFEPYTAQVKTRVDHTRTDAAA